MAFCFPKSVRLRTRKDFSCVQKYSKYKKGSFISLKVRFRGKKETFARLGVTVSKRFGKAFLRNRFKRLVREAFRHVQDKLPAADIIVFPGLNAKEATFSQIQQEILKLSSSQCSQQ